MHNRFLNYRATFYLHSITFVQALQNIIHVHGVFTLFSSILISFSKPIEVSTTSVCFSRSMPYQKQKLQIAFKYKKESQRNIFTQFSKATAFLCNKNSFRVLEHFLIHTINIPFGFLFFV